MSENQSVQKPEAMMVRLRKMLADDIIQDQLKNALAENAGAFATSILEVVYSSKYLQECEPREVIMECMKAATLNLPINPNLGFAYIIAYKKKPQFQMGYRGYIQLAMRTGQFRFLNAGVVYDGMEIHQDYLTGDITISGQKKSENATGYFAYMELLNGYRRTQFMIKDAVLAHAKKFSKTWGMDNSSWTTNFDAMAIKTQIRLLSKYFPMSIKMAAAITQDTEEEPKEKDQANQGEFIDIETGEVKEAQEQKQPVAQETKAPF